MFYCMFCFTCDRSFTQRRYVKFVFLLPALDVVNPMWSVANSEESLTRISRRRRPRPPHAG